MKNIFTLITCLLFVSIISFAQTANKRFPWTTTDVAEIQALIDSATAKGLAIDDTVLLLKKVVEIGNDNIKSFDELLALGGEKIKPITYCVLCRNRKIFLVESFKYAAQHELDYIGHYDFSDPVLVKAGITPDPYFDLILRKRPDLGCLMVEKNQITLPEADIVAALKRANRYWSGRMLTPAWKDTAEKYVARIRTLLSTY